MYINGIEFRTSLDYKVKTTIDLDYQQLSNGNYVAVGRGISADTYDCEIITYGTESYITGILSAIDDSLDNHEAYLTLTNFAANEKIFGENVDYTGTLYGVVTDYGFREQQSWKGYNLKLSLRLLAPTFSATAELPEFSGACISVGYASDINRTLSQYDTYYGSYYVNDNRIDSGVFKGIFSFTKSELANLREWIRVNRDTAFEITALNGITYMFGPVDGEYPHNVKIINMTEDKLFGLNRWLVQIMMVKNY